MHFELHRYVRKVLISEIQTFLNLHPFYSNNQPKIFSSSPTIVTERFNFEGRHFPIVVVSTTNATEKRMGMDRLVNEVYGHVRPTTILSFFAAKVDDDPQYTGTYTDAKFLIEIVNAGKETEEDIKLKVTQTFPTIEESKFFDIPEDGRLTNIIPGARIIIGAFNDRRPGSKLEIETFAEKRFLGDIYGSLFDITAEIEVYAQTTNEIEELLDLITAQATYLLPQRLHYGHYITVKDVSSKGINKDGKLGEEAFKGDITLKLLVELNMFIPFEIVERYTLSLAIRKNKDIESPEDKIILLAES